MSLGVTPTWGTVPPNTATKADWIAYISGLALNLTGTVGTSDLASGAVTAPKTTAGPHFYDNAPGGTTDVITVALANAPTLAAGLWFLFKASGANTTVVTVNANGTGAKSVKKLNGADLQAGDLLAGTIVGVLYDGTNYILMTPVAKPTRIYGGTAGFSANNLTLTLTPSTLTLLALTGIEIEMTVPSANTGAVTLTINALTAKPVTKLGTAALVNADLAANQVIRVLYDGTQFQLLTPLAQAQAGAVVATARNLVCRTGSPETSRLSCTADEVVLKTSGGDVYLASNVNTYADMGASGAGGLDTGVEANSTFYHLWLIYNPSTGTLTGLISLSSTAPTLPSGYTYKALVSVAYNGSGGDFVVYHQYNREIFISAQIAFTGNSPTVNTSVSLAGAVPPLAKIVTGFLGNTTNNVLLALVYGDSVHSIGAQALVCGSAALAESQTTLYVSGQFRQIMRDAQTIYWISNTARACFIYVNGYTI